MALTMSFMRLEDSLVNVRSSVGALITDCNARVGMSQSVCDMIPPSSNFDTDADLNNVSA